MSRAGTDPPPARREQLAAAGFHDPRDDHDQPDNNQKRHAETRLQEKRGKRNGQHAVRILTLLLVTFTLVWIAVAHGLPFEMGHEAYTTLTRCMPWR